MYIKISQVYQNTVNYITGYCIAFVGLLFDCANKMTNDNEPCLNVLKL